MNRYSDTLRTVAPILAQHVHGYEMLRTLASWERLSDPYDWHETDDGERLNGDVAEAVYWLGNDWHSGQWCPLYSAMCVCGFKPGPISNGPEPDSYAGMIRADLGAIMGGRR